MDVVGRAELGGMNELIDEAGVEVFEEMGSSVGVEELAPDVPVELDVGSKEGKLDSIEDAPLDVEVTELFETGPIVDIGKSGVMESPDMIELSNIVEPSVVTESLAIVVLAADEVGLVELTPVADVIVAEPPERVVCMEVD